MWRCPRIWFSVHPTSEIFIWNSPEFWTELKSGHSVQFSSGQKNLYLPVVLSVQFSSGQKKGVVFFGPASTPKNAQKTPQNAQKRPKTPQKRPKTPPKRQVFGVCFFSSVQFRSVFSGQVSSGHFRSVQVKYLSFRSVQFRWISPVGRTLNNIVRLRLRN